MDYNNPNDYWRGHTDPYKGMTDEERMLSGCLQCVMYMFALAIGLILCVLLFGSCKSVEYVPVIDHQTDTLIITKQQRDSIYMHDSIFVKQQGDTLTIERWHTKYVESIKHDTLYQSHIDSIPMPYPVTEYVEKPLTWWQQLRMHLGGILLFVALIYAFVKWGIPFIKKLIA